MPLDTKLTPIIISLVSAEVQIRRDKPKIASIIIVDAIQELQTLFTSGSISMIGNLLSTLKTEELRIDSAIPKKLVPDTD